MKIRTGFVSNSSSSSFIAAVKQTGESCDKCGRTDPDFLGLLACHENGETCLDQRGLPDVVELYRQKMQEYGYDPDRDVSDGLKCTSCQGTETQLIQRSDNKLYQIECAKCGARGPAAPKDKAEHVWKKVNSDMDIDEEERGMHVMLQTILTRGEKLTKEGYELACFSISHHDPAMEALLKSGKEHASIIILDSDW